LISTTSVASSHFTSLHCT